MQVVILCGGKGTRSYPFTEYFPKVMMPIGGTPIIVHLMRLYAVQGFKRFILAGGHRQEILRDYFEGRFLEWDVTIVDTGSESDTAERIQRCASYVGSTFFATYGDGLGNIDLHALLDYHRATGGLATVTSVQLRSQYGLMVSDDGGQVQEFREKPILADRWINAGFFVFNSEVFGQWRGANLESDVLPHLARMRQLYTFRHEGFWKAMDTSKDQQEFEQIHNASTPPWMLIERKAARAAC